ncbi:MAG: hypothetical protein JWR09_5882 [Mucilaginibacter sp.]|jgi:hypothetical protein|nr:hypothetical protein [Mucilaginibacter sp.]
MAAGAPETGGRDARLDLEASHNPFRRGIPLALRNVDHRRSKCRWRFLGKTATNPSLSLTMGVTVGELLCICNRAINGCHLS